MYASTQPPDDTSESDSEKENVAAKRNSKIGTLEQQLQPQIKKKRTLMPTVSKPRPLLQNPIAKIMTKNNIPEEFICRDGTTYVSVKQLGKGGFGSVHLVYVKGQDPSITFALKKIIYKKNQPKSSRKESIENELSILQKLAKTCNFDPKARWVCFKKSCNIDFSGSGTFFLITENIPGTTLDQFIKTRNVGLTTKMTVIYRLIKIIKNLHAQGIAHGDLKPANIMVNPDDLSVVLIDFGLACNTLDVCRAKFKAGTPGYMDPDTWILNPKNTTLQNNLLKDIWAFGIVCLYILDRKLFTEGFRQGIKQTKGKYKITRDFINNMNQSTHNIPVTELSTTKTYIPLFVKNSLMLDPNLRFQNGNELCEFAQKEMQLVLLTKELVRFLQSNTADPPMKNVPGYPILNQIHQQNPTDTLRLAVRKFLDELTPLDPIVPLISLVHKLLNHSNTTNIAKYKSIGIAELDLTYDC